VDAPSFVVCHDPGRWWQGGHAGGGGSVARRGHPKGVVGAFLVGCAVVAAIGRAGARSEAPKGEHGHARAGRRQEHREAAKGQEV
jgi:hypothetical protein